MTFRTRLPIINFTVDEATMISVLSEWIRQTYEINDRDYSLEIIKSAIDGCYHITGTFIDLDQRPLRQRPSFDEVVQTSVVPPFTVTPGKSADDPSS